jgi:hypothetical protein
MLVACSGLLFYRHGSTYRPASKFSFSVDLAADSHDTADLQRMGRCVKHRDNDMSRDCVYRFHNHRGSLQLPSFIDQFAQDGMPFGFFIGQADAEGVVEVAEVIALGTPGLFERLFEVFSDGEV